MRNFIFCSSISTFLRSFLKAILAGLRSQMYGPEWASLLLAAAANSLHLNLTRPSQSAHQCHYSWDKEYFTCQMPNHMQLDEEESGASPGLSAALRHQRNNSVSSDSTGYMSSGSSEDDERPERVPQVTKQRQQRLRWQLQGAAMGRGPSTLNGIGETSNAPIISSLSSLEASTAAAADRTRRYRAPSASSTGSGTALAQSDVIEDPGIIYHNLLLFEQSLRDAFSREQRLKRKYTSTSTFLEQFLSVNWILQSNMSLHISIPWINAVNVNYSIY